MQKHKSWWGGKEKFLSSFALKYSICSLRILGHKCCVYVLCKMGQARLAVMHGCKNFTTEIKSKFVKLVAKKYRVHWQRNKAKTCKEINGASVQTCWIFPEQIHIFTCLDDALCCFFQQYFDSSAVCAFYKTCTWMYKFSLKVFLPSSASDKNWIVMASMPKKNS